MALLKSFFPKDLFKDPWSILFLLFTFIFLLVEYFGWQGPFHHMFQGGAFYRSLSQMDRNFFAQLWTTASFLILFVVVPSLCLKILFKKDSFEWILGRGELSSSYKLYLIAYAFMFLPLILAASSPAFYRFYPLYRPSGISDWMCFELVYLPQFFAVEFFFRGPILSFLSKRIGPSSLLVMAFPYALIHIHKPFPEAIGSIVAGVVLGHLALKGRSIWGGVVLHMLVALTMDSASLYFSGTLSSFH